MARHVVSVISAAPRRLGVGDPVLEANAYAVAEDVDLELVLRGGGVELAALGGHDGDTALAGTSLSSGVTKQDLRALIESGVAVHVETESATERGLSPADLVDGVLLATADDLADLMRTAQAVLTW